MVIATNCVFAAKQNMRCRNGANKYVELERKVLSAASVRQRDLTRVEFEEVIRRARVAVYSRIRREGCASVNRHVHTPIEL